MAEKHDKLADTPRGVYKTVSGDVSAKSVPMENQVGNLARTEKASAIIKRILAKGQPVAAEKVKVAAKGLLSAGKIGPGALKAPKPVNIPQGVSGKAPVGLKTSSDPFMDGFAYELKKEGIAGFLGALGGGYAGMTFFPKHPILAGIGGGIAGGHISEKLLGRRKQQSPGY